MTPFNPDTPAEIALLAFLGLCTVLPVLIPAILALRKQGRHIGEIKEQVSNTHTTNLREDIDELSRLVREGFSETRKDIGGLREEMRTERQERIAGDQMRLTPAGR